MTQKGGFTIVEMLVVVTILGVLVTMSVAGLGKYQESNRDTSRASSVQSISEALEKFYDKNGEYPSCTAITADADSVTVTTLPGLNRKAILVPNAPSTETNSIRCGQTLSFSGNDFFQYSGDSSPGCTGSVSCSRYSLKYRNESESTIMVLNSRRL